MRRESLGTLIKSIYRSRVRILILDGFLKWYFNVNITGRDLEVYKRSLQRSITSSVSVHDVRTWSIWTWEYEGDELGPSRVGLSFR